MWFVYRDAGIISKWKPGQWRHDSASLDGPAGYEQGYKNRTKFLKKDKKSVKNM
jgi:hypothetical protein